MANEYKSKGFLKLFLRGVLGGVAGSVVVAAVVVCLLRPATWDNWLGYFLLIFIVSFPFGIVTGATLAVALWLVYGLTPIQLGRFATALCGTAIGMFIIGLWWAITYNPYKQSYEQSYWMDNAIGLVLIGLAFGGIPGILMGIKRKKESDTELDTFNNKVESAVVDGKNR